MNCQILDLVEAVFSALALLLSVWFEACAEHLHLHIFQGWR